MKVRLACLLVSCALAAACGGDDDGSGVDGGKAVTELSADEVSALCEWAIDVQGGENHSEDCGDFTIETGTVAECEAEYAGIPASCSSVTVAELEDCVNAIADDPCEGFGSQACSEFIQCSIGGS